MFLLLISKINYIYVIIISTIKTKSQELNMDSISSIASTVGIGLVGAAVSRTSMWVSNSFESATGRHVGQATDYIMPECVKKAFSIAGKSFNYPLNALSKQLQYVYIYKPYEEDRIDMKELGKRGPQLDKFLKIILAPIMEEIIFRGGVQKLGEMGLVSLGIPSPLAKVICIVAANTMFTAAHLEDDTQFNTREFSSVFVGGMTDGIICSEYGLTSSIASHLFSNLSTYYIK